MFIQKVIQSLISYDVQYALVGGYAVALHGAIRGTVAIDLIVPIDKESFKRTEQAMMEIGLQ